LQTKTYNFGGFFGCNGFIGFVELVYFIQEVFEFCSIGIDYLLNW
jgi:hypothetical protein